MISKSIWKRGNDMIIDAGGYLGDFPYRRLKRNDPNKLDGYISKTGIEKMIVSSINAVFFKDTSQGNDMLYESLSNYRGNIDYIPFAVCNPAYPGWEDDLKIYIMKQGFKGIDLFPQYHNYSLNDSCASLAARFAKEYGIPVRITNGFENIRQRSDMDILFDLEEFNLISYAEKNRGVNFMFLGFHSMSIAKMAAEKHLINVYYDFARSDVHPGIIDDMLEIIREYKADNMCFASFSPMQYVEPQILKIMNKDICEEDRKKISEINLCRCLDIK